VAVAVRTLFAKAAKGLCIALKIGREKRKYRPRGRNLK